jgi:ABC-2 type transport system permease protein
MHLIRIYRRSLGAHIRSSLEYEADFWIMVVAALLMQGAGVVLIATIFGRVPHINGWNVWEVVLVSGIMAFSFGVTALLAEGTWNLAWLVNQGELDRMLVRPYPVILQVCSVRVGMNAFGDLVIGSGLLIAALTHLHIAWTPQRVLLALLLFASGVTVKVALVIAANATSFWLPGPVNTFAASMDQVADLARYPITIYWVGLRAALCTVVPFAFVGFFPASYLLGHRDFGWVGLLTPLVAIYCVVLAIGVFRRGLRRYEGAGH